MTPSHTFQMRERGAAPTRALMYGSLSVSARTHRGTRPRNQDAFLVADLTARREGLGPEVAAHALGARGTLLAVSDGTGEAGETASELTITAFHRLLDVLPDELAAEERLARAAHYTAKYLYGHFRRRPAARGVGATLTAVLVHGEVATIAQIGDSRAYLLRGDRAEQLTRDQTLAQELIDAGAIEASARPPDLMLQALGSDPTVSAVVTTVDVRAGDMLLVCSDGLSNLVVPDEMVEAVRETADVDGACRRLVELALDRGAVDNLTVVLARVEALSRDLDPNKAVTWPLRNGFASE